MMISDRNKDSVDVVIASIDGIHQNHSLTISWNNKHTYKQYWSNTQTCKLLHSMLNTAKSRIFWVLDQTISGQNIAMIFPTLTLPQPSYSDPEPCVLWS